jgi:PmbA protein
MGSIDVEKLYRRAIDLGAVETEIFYVFSRDISISISDRIEIVETSISRSIGIRVAMGKRVAIVGTQDLRWESLEQAIRSAISIAKTMPEDPSWGGFNHRIGVAGSGGYHDKRTAEASPEDLGLIASTLIRGVTESTGISKPSRGSCGAGYARVEVINPYGGPIAREETRAWVYVYAKARDSGEGSYGDYQLARSIGALRPYELGLRVGSISKSFVGARAPENGEYDLILSPKIAGSFISAMLSPAISALSVQRERSPLAGKIGSLVASELITIADEGVDPRYLGSRGFDDEGHPTSFNIIIERGILKSYVYDSYTARIDGRESSGNAWRGYSSSPTPAPNHLIIKPGDSRLEEMIRETRKGIYVLSTIGEWLSNPVSGNLNATITNAYLVENGEIRAPINGGVISADFYELIRRKIALVGREIDDLERISAPPMLFTRVRIAGK